jgi:hypothetical protein
MGALKALVEPGVWQVVAAQGAPGEPGPQVFVGPEPPTDPDLDLWFDTTDDGSNALTQALGDALYHRLDGLVAAGEIGPDSTASTSGTSPVVTDTITVPDLGPGLIIVFAMGFYDKTVTTDRTAAYVTAAGVEIARLFEESAPNSTRWAASMMGTHAVSGGSTTVINVNVVRWTGSGAMSANATVQSHTLSYIFIPTAS